MKWILSPGTSQEGLWHGVYATQLGVGKSHTILQECGLLTDWIESTFAAPFKKECKDVASATQLGVGKSHTILQECGLLTDWIESTFAAPFKKECKDVASGKDGVRNPKQFLFIPAGDTHDSVSDPPPAS